MIMMWTHEIHFHARTCTRNLRKAPLLITVEAARLAGTSIRVSAAAALGTQPKAKPMIQTATKAMKTMKEAPKAPMFAHFKANKIKDPVLLDACVAAHKESFLVCLLERSWKLSYSDFTFLVLSLLVSTRFPSLSSLAFLLALNI